MVVTGNGVRINNVKFSSSDGISTITVGQIGNRSGNSGSGLWNANDVSDTCSINRGIGIASAVTSKGFNKLAITRISTTITGIIGAVTTTTRANMVLR